MAPASRGNKKIPATWRDCEIRSNKIYLNGLTVAICANEQRRFANNNNLKTSLFSALALCVCSCAHLRFLVSPIRSFLRRHFISFFYYRYPRSVQWMNEIVRSSRSSGDDFGITTSKIVCLWCILKYESHSMALFWMLLCVSAARREPGSHQHSRSQAKKRQYINTTFVSDACQHWSMWPSPSPSFALYRMCLWKTMAFLRVSQKINET